jgi:peroxiredoxin
MKVFEQNTSRIASGGRMMWLMAAALSVGILAGCGAGTNGPKNAISGVFSGENGLGVDMDLRRWVPGKNGQGGKFESIGKATSDMQGQFQLIPDRALVMDYYQLMVSGMTPMVVIMDSTMHVHIKAEIPDGGFIADATITGSKAAAEVHEYYAKAMPLQTTLSMLRGTMQRTKDKEKMQELSDRAAQKKIEADRWAKQFIKEHPGSPALLGPLEHLEPRSNADLFAEVLEATETQLRNGAFHKALSIATQSAQATRNNARERVVKKGNGANPPRPAKNSRYGVGDEAPDIAMADPDGNIRRLSDLRGKVVLVDFWASWCGPCRRENPNVVRAYQEFNAEGFEVFSVSLDQNADRWKAAIAQDGLNWPNHVCDLKGWQNEAARAYGVSSIPHALLVDQNGTIAATHLRGPALAAKLNELLR